MMRCPLCGAEPLLLHDRRTTCCGSELRALEADEHDRGYPRTLSTIGTEAAGRPSLPTWYADQIDEMNLGGEG